MVQKQMLCARPRGLRHYSRWTACTTWRNFIATTWLGGFYQHVDPQGRTPIDRAKELGIHPWRRVATAA